MWAQLEEAQRKAVLINDLVLAEAVWALRSVYRQAKPAIVEVLRQAGNADCLISARNAASGCDFTATFDRAMQALPGVKVL